MPEDISKHKYICIFYWLFILVQTVLEIRTTTPRHLHTWAKDPSSVPGFLERQIHTWIWTDLRNIKADFREYTEWEKSGLIWSWWDERRMHSPLGLGILVDYHGGCSAFPALSHPTFQHWAWKSSSLKFPSENIHQKFPKVKSSSAILTLIQTVELTCCDTHAFIIPCFTLFSLSWFPWFKNHVLGHVITLRWQEAKMHSRQC